MQKNVLLAVTFCLCCWMLLLPARGVWAPDEARYAEVAREMKEQGEWLIPSLNGELYTQKPPLFFDMIRLFSIGSEGVPEWAAKMPSIAGALGTLILVALLAARLYGPKGAWLAPLLLGTTMKFFWNAQFGQIDMWLTFLVTFQIYLGLGVAWGQARRHLAIPGLMVLGFAGMISKGPVGCLLPWLVVGLYLAVRKDWPGLKRVGLPWIIPGVIVLTALWLAAAGLVEGWHYPQGLLWKQTVTRYMDPWHHYKPWYYFLGVILTDGLPYSLFLPALAAPLIRKKRWKEPGVLLPLVWIATYLVFFSLSSAKRSVYILPVYPALALLVAYGVVNWQSERFPARGLRWVLMVLGSLAAVLTLFFVLKIPEDYRDVVPWIAVSGGLLFCALVASWILAGRRLVVRGIVTAACAFALFISIGLNPAIQRLDRVKTPVPFALAADGYLERGGIVAVFPNLIPSVNYYLESPTPQFKEGQEEEALRFLANHPENLLLVQDEDWTLPDPPGLAVMDGSIGSSTYTLYRLP